MARYLYKLTCNRHKQETLEHIADTFITLEVNLPRNRKITILITPGLENKDADQVRFIEQNDNEIKESRFPLP